MAVRDLLNVDPGSSEPVLMEAIIAEDAASATDLVEVTIPSFDRKSRWGPCEWMPRGVASFPKRGDRAVVGFAETARTGEPEVWIVAWWSEADIGSPGGGPDPGTSYIHTQSGASADWLVTHNLGRIPLVSVQIQSGSDWHEVETSVIHHDLNSFTVHAASAFSGRAVYK